MTVLRSVFRRRGLGYRPDKPDERDYSFRERLGDAQTLTLPSRVSLIHPDVQPKNQGGSDSCTAQAWVQAVRLARLHRGIQAPDLSALFNYFVGRKEWSRGSLDDTGSYLRAAAKAYTKFGNPPEDAWPMRVLFVNRQPPWRSFQLGYDLKGDHSYYRIMPAQPDDVRRALAGGYPVVGGWLIDQSFLADRQPSVIDVPKGRAIGGHAMVIVGYDEQAFTLLNSWGESWGSGGYARVTEAFVGRAEDSWAVVA